MILLLIFFQSSTNASNLCKNPNINYTKVQFGWLRLFCFLELQ